MPPSEGQFQDGPPPEPSPEPSPESSPNGLPNSAIDHHRSNQKPSQVAGAHPVAQSDHVPGSLHRPPKPRGRRGVVGIILRGDSFLVIRRSQWVTAPGLLCFAGGGIEPGETEAEALVREMQEELALEVQPVRRVWESVTAWGTHLAWWTAAIEPDAQPIPNPEEVASVMWMPHSELRIAAGMLPSLPQFLDAWTSGRLTLPINP